MSLRQFCSMWDRSREIWRESMYGSAVVAAVIANTNRDTKRRSTPFTPDDFLPRIEADTPKRASDSTEQSPEQMLAMCVALFGPPKQQQPTLIEAPSPEQTTPL